MIQVRDPESIYQIDGAIKNGSFHGRWHFSFGDYYDSQFEDFGTLRVFNDDINLIGRPQALIASSDRVQLEPR
jgi:redox-sensitive bicupin YhaK (pirin superfamily)